MIEVKITGTEIDIRRCTDLVFSDECGGVNIFIGTVRSNTSGKNVLRLEFECYERMAIKELNKIASYVTEHFGVKKIVIHHRVGVLNISDTAVLIAVSAPHRDSAFKACRYAIDKLKETVPIWKKEVFENEEVWVSARP